MNKIIFIVFIFSGLYAQCDSYNQSQCRSDDSCNWVEDIEFINCSTLSTSGWGPGSCEYYYPDCYEYLDYGGWYGSWSTECGGGTTQIDNSYCEEIQMPECSELTETGCNDPEYGEGCQWIENIESVTCASLAWNEELCEASPDCNYSCWDADGYFGWCEPSCTGGMTYIDSGSCEASDIGDVNSDGSINVIDIVELVQIVLSAEYDIIGDINNDGSMNIVDIVLLVSLVLGEQ